MSLTQHDNEQFAILFQTLQGRYQHRADLHFDASKDLADHLGMCLAAAALGDLDEKVANKFAGAAKRSWQSIPSQTQ